MDGLELIARALADFDNEPVGQQSTARDLDYHVIFVDRVRSILRAVELDQAKRPPQKQER